MAQKTDMRLIGVVENMTVGDGLRLAAAASGSPSELGVPLLGTVPLDPRLREAARRGRAARLGRAGARPTARAIVEIAEAIDGARREAGRPGIVEKRCPLALLSAAAFFDLARTLLRALRPTLALAPAVPPSTE